MWSRVDTLVRAIDGERRRWTAAGLLVLTTVASGAAFSGGGVPATADRARDMASAGSSVESAPVRGFTPATPPLAAPIPLGKGMWLNRFERSAGGDPHALVARAQQLGLTHLYVRVGSSWKGFYAQDVLERLLPVAHEAGIKVVGWDFPNLRDIGADVSRGRAAIWYTTATGHRLDAFSADIETLSEGTNLTAGGAFEYGAALRAQAGPGYPLIATVPRPSPKRWFPYAEATASFDAIAPMVYWGKRDPVGDVRGAIADLRRFGKPVLPVGQAYDSAIDGWTGGSPSKQALASFTQAAFDDGALGVSFWVWETASSDHWAAIGEASQFTVDPDKVAKGDPPAVGYLQRSLTGIGHPTVVDGTMGEPTKAALESFQRRQGLPLTRQLDPPTAAALVGPATPPSK